MLLPRRFAVYISPLYGLKAIALGPSPTGIVSITVFVVISITGVLLVTLLSTYIFPLYGLKAIVDGNLPGIGAK